MPNEVMVSSFSDFHEIVGGMEANRHIFRGVADAGKYLLIPSVGRLSYSQRGNSGLLSFEK